MNHQPFTIPIKPEIDVKGEPRGGTDSFSSDGTHGISTSNIVRSGTTTIISKPSPAGHEDDGSKPVIAAGTSMAPDGAQTTPPLITVRPQPVAMAMVAPLSQSAEDARLAEMPSWTNMVIELDEYETTIPDSVNWPFLAQTGFETRDPRLVRLCSLATQTLVRKLLKAAKSTSEGQTTTHLSLSAVEEELEKLQPSKQL